jgi:hypothetical protein
MPGARYKAQIPCKFQAHQNQPESHQGSHASHQGEGLAAKDADKAFADKFTLSDNDTPSGSDGEDDPQTETIGAWKPFNLPGLARSLDLESICIT